MTEGEQYCLLFEENTRKTNIFGKQKHKNDECWSIFIFQLVAILNHQPIFRLVTLKMVMVGTG